MSSEKEEEDRLSNLPDKIIHLILSFINLNYAIRTSILSKRWKHTWTLMPCLNIDSRAFRSVPQFTNFVNHALSHRNLSHRKSYYHTEVYGLKVAITEISILQFTNFVSRGLSHHNSRYHREVSGVKVAVTEIATEVVIEKIVKYAYSMPNIRTLTMIWLIQGCNNLPHCLFRSHSLKHLTLATNGQSYFRYWNIHIPWDFPALETLNLSNMCFSWGVDRLDLFFRCVNLKELTLRKCSMYKVDVFNISARQLSNLTIKNNYFYPKIFNVVAPQLKNLTASVASNFSSPYSLQLSTTGFNSLEKVNISLSNRWKEKDEYVPVLIKLFEKLRSAKFLILNGQIIETLSTCLDELSFEPCPFDNLKCLKINNMLLKQNDDTRMIPDQIRRYLLEKSPSATVIMDLPQDLIMMDSVHYSTSMIEEIKVDRISSLPNDIICRILAFLDMKYVVQFCTLSRIWKNLWTLMPHLILNSRIFDKVSRFSKFVDHVLSHRTEDVSTLDLTVRTTTSELVIEKIVKYAYAHNVRELAMICVTRKINKCSQYLLSCRTLKHLNLSDDTEYPWGNSFLESTWDFPALETLHLSNINMCLYNLRGKSIDPFSKCLNLKDLTLHRLSVRFMNEFIVSAPQLRNLTITDPEVFPKVFNVISPQLENLTASIMHSCKNSESEDILKLTTNSLYLEKVNLSLAIRGRKKQMNVPMLLNLFQKLRSAKILILNCEFIETMSLYLDQLSPEPCPFNNLKCLKIENGTFLRKDHTAKVAIQVKNYLLENSPSANFIMDLSRKRSREQIEIDAKSKKVAKLEAEIQIQKETVSKEKRILEAKIQMQDEVIANQKAMLEETKLQHEKLMSGIIKRKMEEVKLQVKRENPDYEIIRSMGYDIKSVMDLMPESLSENAETQFFSQYDELKGLLLTCINASEWEKIETELGNIWHSERTRSDNNHYGTGVHAVKLSGAVADFI